jgi:hypothetical protein
MCALRAEVPLRAGRDAESLLRDAESLSGFDPFHAEWVAFFSVVTGPVGILLVRLGRTLPNRKMQMARWRRSWSVR